LSRITIIAKESDPIQKLVSKLNRNGFSCSVVADRGQALARISTEPPDLLLVDIDISPATQPTENSLLAAVAKTIPILALIPAGRLNELATNLKITDFAVKPFSIGEVALRVKRLLSRAQGAGAGAGEIIKSGDLDIHLARYEVRLSGRLVELTFREYKLLSFLAANRGQVFTREVLLNKVWGYDYFGGDRTVDVHIRRLRSKVEDANHTFIDTVRNIGYRFRIDK
jgi:DNA-binding response OmpR family regulator